MGWGRVRSGWDHTLFLLGPFLSLPHLTQSPKMLWQLDLGPALPVALGAACLALSHPAPPCPAAWKVMFPNQTAGGMGASRPRRLPEPEAGPSVGEHLPCFVTVPRGG